MEYPVTLNKNYVNEDDTITVSTGDTAKHNIYDWDRGTTWQSIGSDDITVETIEVELYEGADIITRDIDRLIILDTNIKEFYLEYYKAASWTKITETDINDNSGVNIYISWTKVTDVEKIRLTMLKTIVADEDKYLSELIVGEYGLEIKGTVGVMTNPWARGDINNQRRHRLGAGEGKTYQDWDKYKQNINVRGVNTTLRNSLEDLYDEHKAFIWVWDRNDLTKASGIYYVNWIGGFVQTRDIKIDEFNIVINLEEV